MRRGQAMKRRLILVVAPTHGEVVFLVELELRRLHRRSDELTS
jgi:hypothetical protein